MHNALLALSLALSSAHAAVPAAAVETDPGPLREAFFLRGGFNGWGLDNALQHKGKGIYETEILVSPGNHGFKLGTRDWNREWAPSRDARPCSTSWLERHSPGGSISFAPTEIC